MMKMWTLVLLAVSVSGDVIPGKGSASGSGALQPNRSAKSEEPIVRAALGL